MRASCTRDRREVGALLEKGELPIPISYVPRKHFPHYFSMTMVFYLLVDAQGWGFAASFFNTFKIVDYL